jgi:hypothetical protein
VFVTVKENIEQYNQRVAIALENIKEELPSFAIMERGRQHGEVSLYTHGKRAFLWTWDLYLNQVRRRLWKTLKN